MNKRLVILFAVFLTAGAYADSDDVAAFKEAWTAYESAIESDDDQLEIETAARVLDAGKTIFPESDERLVVVTHNYGVALSDTGQRDDAVPVLEEALRLGEIVYGEKGVELVLILADLADAEAEPFRPGSQLRHYKRALKIVDANFGRQGFQYADLAFRAARNVYLMSLSPTARKYMIEARDIYASLPEPATVNVGMANFYLGKMEFSERDFRDSSEYLESALTSFEGDDTANHALRLLTRAMLVQTYEHQGLTEQATQQCIAIGRENQFSPNQDYEPLFRVAPMYPVSMLRAGNQGIVDIEFTIDENGFVREPVVINREVNGREKNHSSAFDKAALGAVERFRYAPRFENDEPVPVDGVKTRITFALER